MALEALPDPVYLLELRSTRVAVIELLLLAVAGGTLGAYVVLRRLAFFTHAVGTATFPGVVLAEAARFSPRLAALTVAVAYAGSVERAGRGGRDPGGAATGLMLVLALATGTILASDVFSSGAGVDRLLFGSTVALSDADVAVAASAAVVAVIASLLLGRAWTAVAFEPEGAPSLGIPSRRADLALLVIVGATAVAALPAVGSLLVTSLFVVPAAIARLVTGSVGALVGASIAIAAVQGVVGLYAALWLDVPPGPAIAVLGAVAYAVLAAVLALAPSRAPQGVTA